MKSAEQKQAARAGAAPDRTGNHSRRTVGQLAGQAGEATAPKQGEPEQAGGNDRTTSLAGELIAEAPERPGFWAYRLLADGRLLETELTSEEWRRLHEERMAKMNATIDRLNQHPLNVAALELLREIGAPCGSGGTLQWLHILSLAAEGLSCDEGNEDEPPWSEFIVWVQDVASMKAALSKLEDAGVAADDLGSRDAHDAAQLVLGELGVSL
jgi:hypothetical protein